MGMGNLRDTFSLGGTTAGWLAGGSLAAVAATGVMVKIKRVGGKTLIRSAFIANKGRTVFKRTGPKRLPIEPVQTIGIPQMFNAKRITEVVLQLVEDDFPQQFDREARYYLSKA